MTLSDLVQRFRRRSGDIYARVWPDEEVLLHLRNGYQQVAQTIRVFFDWTYLENLPTAFSQTNPWEEAYTARFPGAMLLATGNYTYDDEQLLIDPERTRYGPYNCTALFEVTDGFLARSGASTGISATAELPDTIATLDRVTWDKRGIDGLDPRFLTKFDSRFHFTEGEVYGFVWELDGIRTLRKVDAGTSTWGTLRDPTDLSTDACDQTAATPRLFSYTTPDEAFFFTAVFGTWDDQGLATYTSAFEADYFPDDWRTVEGPAAANHGFEYAGGEMTTLGIDTASPAVASWGLARRIPGHHPIGDGTGFGIPRRPFLEGHNVRVEFFRTGRVMVGGSDVCELPDVYAKYLVDYALAQALAHEGPGQDLALAQHFDQRWQRGLARLRRRSQVVDRERPTVIGGEGRPSIMRPPRPSRPWPYGSQVRNY
jgi:hypothetical protein